MIVGATCDEGTYHFFQAKELALSLMMPPNGNAKCKKKKEVVKIFKVSMEGRLVTFTCKIFGIPLWKCSPYTLHHCLVDVGSKKEIAMPQERLPYLPPASEEFRNTPSNVGR